MQRTKIGYLTHSWNPIAMRCTRVSDGCKNCWHLRMAKRLANNDSIPMIEAGAYDGMVPILRERELEAPLRLRKPARIGVQFMGDLFHESVPDEFITEIFGVMAVAGAMEQGHTGQPFWVDVKKNISGGPHTFIILTKRPERMMDFLRSQRQAIAHAAYRWAHNRRDAGYLSHQIGDREEYSRCYNPGRMWPLSNLWLGVSVEDQKTANERIPLLLQTPAAVRFVSYEPALWLVDFTKIGPCLTVNALDGSFLITSSGLGVIQGVGHGPKLDWIIMGGETGPGARPPIHPGWARSVRDQCQAAGVPFWFKQWGEYSPVCSVMYKVGHQRAGRLLDGKEYNEVPLGGHQ